MPINVFFVFLFQIEADDDEDDENGDNISHKSDKNPIHDDESDFEIDDIYVKKKLVNSKRRE